MIDAAENVHAARTHIIPVCGNLEVGALVLEIDRLLVRIEELLDESA
ncbi:MAG TPA: hypothetical protein VIU34_00775 [Steroidobacter sp.]